MICLPNNLNATKIDLRNQGLKEIPIEVFKYANLRKLFLQNNKIEKIPKEIAKLKQLNTLDLTNNKITSLYAKLFELKKLKVLILNSNNIKTISQNISKFQNLRVLGLANNKISNIHPLIIELKELKELNLSGNDFPEFPEWIKYLRKLERVWFKGYDYSVPELETFKNDNPSLQRIYTSNNITKEPLNKLPSKMSYMETKENPDVKKKKIFISHSHQDDDKWLLEVKKNLKVLKFFGQNDFEVWDDEKIDSGQDWKTEIKKALKESTAAILLISTNFLASDFIVNEELQPLLERAKNEGTLILPLILSPCRFASIESLNKFQSVNNPKTQILSKLSKPDQDEILLKLVEDVENHINL